MDYPTIIAVLAVAGQIILIYKKEWLEDNHPRLYAVLKWGFFIIIGRSKFLSFRRNYSRFSEAIFHLKFLIRIDPYEVRF